MTITTYELVLMHRNLDTPSFKVWQHTGYALIKYIDGVPSSMKTLEAHGRLPALGDMYVISSIESPCSDAEGWIPLNSELSSAEKYVPEQIYTGGEWKNTTQEWLFESEYNTVPIDIKGNETPLDIFKKMERMGKIVNILDDTYVLGIDYNALYKNCNTFTYLLGLKYLNTDVFEKINLDGKYFLGDENASHAYGDIELKFNIYKYFLLAKKVLNIISKEELSLMETTFSVSTSISSVSVEINDGDNEYMTYVPSFQRAPKDNLQASFSSAEVMRSPLTLDLDGDGVETVSVNDGVYFDHDGNGFAEKSGWVSKDDAILVRDLNNNGQIDDGSELFGDQTILSDGEKAANGFEALAA